MSAKLLDGEAAAAKLKEKIKARVEAVKSAGGNIVLNAVQVGENAASRVYIKNQKASCEEVGITYELKELPADNTQDGMNELIEKLKVESYVTVSILHRPLSA